LPPSDQPIEAALNGTVVEAAWPIYGNRRRLLLKERKGAKMGMYPCALVLFKACKFVFLTMILSGGMAGPAMAQQPQSAVPWNQCCGISPWPMGQGVMGPGMMGPGMMGSGYGGSPRHRFAMTSGVPEPYRSMTNPLPRTPETVKRGAAIYEKNCVACHGATGEGNGAAARNLSPPPTNLAWLARMPMAQWDSFLYWSVAEGGAQFKSAMPAFKDVLSKDDLWSVVAYIQARMPQGAR
jgi:mono/diheme cytochrome c family protein